MRVALVLLLVAACGGAPAPAPEPAPAPAPAPAAPFEATDDARRAFAVDFLAAIARRDRAAIEPMTGEAALCEIMAREHPERLEGKDVQACTDEQLRLNAEVLTYYEAAVPESFAAGDAQVSAIDAAQGIYLVTVEPAAGGDPLSVIFLEIEQRRFVVFPRKKEE